MAEAVVDRLEVVDVDHDEAHGVAVAHRAGPVGFQLLEERAAVEAARERVEGGQFVQLAVLPLNFVARLLECREHFGHFDVLLLDFGHIVERGQGPAALAPAADNRHGVDREGARLVALARDAKDDSGSRQSQADGINPGKRFGQILAVRSGPAEFRRRMTLQGIGTHAQTIGEGLVGKYDLLPLIEDQDAFRQRVERGTDTVGDHGRGIEQPQDALEIQPMQQERAGRKENNQPGHGIHQHAKPAVVAQGRQRTSSAPHCSRPWKIGTVNWAPGRRFSSEACQCAR